MSGICKSLAGLMGEWRSKYAVNVLAIDPGNKQNGWCIVESEAMRPLAFGKTDNTELAERIENLADEYGVMTAVIEQVACYGMPVGREVFDTCVWIGRFTEIIRRTDTAVRYITRKDEKMNICHSMRANDATIRRALIDRFARHDFKNGKGTKKDPDWFYGFKGDIWAAYAVGITWLDTVSECKIQAINGASKGAEWEQKSG